MRAPAPPWSVAIGASGGEGLVDLEGLLAALPARLPAVFLVELHRPVGRVSHLRAILARVCTMPVVLAADGERLHVGTVYVGGPADHLSLAARGLAKLVPDRREDHRNRTVDLLFNSVAEHGAARAIGVVLSGHLDDGARGLAAIGHAGGITMVLGRQARSGQEMPESARSFGGRLDVEGDVDTLAAAIVDTVRSAPEPAQLA